MSRAAFLALSAELTPETLQEIEADIALVERMLVEQTESRVEMVSSVVRHTLDAGGKRLRPAFVSLSARAAGSDGAPDRVVPLGACLEMVHMATLIHDDVIDHAEKRRGRPTAARLFGATGSILSGDVLLAKAMAILARDGDLDIIRTVSDAVVQMAEGEVREVETRGCFDLSDREHLEILRMKTAAFVECCCKVGALVAKAPPAVVQAMGRFGHHVGMAYQIADDLLDYRGDALATGKPAGNDFREACATLPLIYLRPTLAEEEARFVRSKFGNGVTDVEVGAIVRWMASRGAFEKAQNAALGHIEEAERALSELPENSAKRLLLAAAQLVVARDR